MTEQQREDIRKLREKGFGYKLIAKELGISANSVKSFCRRNELFEPNGQTTSAHCEQCGKELVHTPKKKKKRFCSDICRQAWWNGHLSLVNKKAVYAYICPACKKEFSVYGNANRKYCSHQCYVAGRFGGVGNE